MLDADLVDWLRWIVHDNNHIEDLDELDQDVPVRDKNKKWRNLMKWRDVLLDSFVRYQSNCNENIWLVEIACHFENHDQSLSKNKVGRSIITVIK